MTGAPRPGDQAPSWPPVRHPFQVSSFGAFAALGAGWWLTQPHSPVDAVLLSWMVPLWNGILVVSGALGMLSALISRRYEAISLLTERSALTGVGGYCALYVVALLDLDGWGKSWYLIVTFAFMGVGATWRLWQVQRRVNWRKRGRR